MHDQDPNFPASIRNSLATTLTRTFGIYIKRFTLNTVPLAALVLANKSQVLQSSHLKLQSRLSIPGITLRLSSVCPTCGRRCGVINLGLDCDACDGLASTIRHLSSSNRSGLSAAALLRYLYTLPTVASESSPSNTLWQSLEEIRIYEPHSHPKYAC